MDFDRNGTPSVVEFGTQPRAAPPATVPDAPTALTATAGNAAVTLNWTAPVNDGGATIINYMIDYSVNAVFFFINDCVHRGCCDELYSK